MSGMILLLYWIDFGIVYHGKRPLSVIPHIKCGAGSVEVGIQGE